MSGSTDSEAYRQLADVYAITLIVPAAYANRPLGDMVCAVLGSVLSAELFAHGGVWIGRQRVQDASMPVSAGSEIRLRRPQSGAYASVTVTAEDICYEDAWLIVVNKRAGWYTGQTPWDIGGNVLVGVEQMLTMRDGSAPRLHLAHQLDRDTSGVLLLTKDGAANGPLQKAFASGQIDKTYLAICQGEPATDAFEIHSGHGRARGGCWRLYALEQVGQELPGGKRIRTADTLFQVTQRMGDCTLIQAMPRTGRTHQIRLHLAGCGLPLLGDTRYGGPLEFRGQMLPGHLLHAARMRLRHPLTGRSLELETPLPEHMAGIVGVG